MEIQQSPLYAAYVASLGWQVLRLPEGNIFIRRLPLLGAYAKIQRFAKLPSLKTLIPLLKNRKVTIAVVEPDASINPGLFRAWLAELSRSFRVSHDHFLPTKTIHINLTPFEEDIFKNFSEAKRRAVRRAIKNRVLIKQSEDIQLMMQTKNKSAGFLGFITTYGIDKLWRILSPGNAAILLAYKKHDAKKPISALLLLFWQKTAYYWLAGATREGKRLFAPTLLVWEALKLAKYRGCRKFDFVGVWDERIPRQNTAWKGFTKFKEGFGGKALYYPLSSTT